MKIEILQEELAKGLSTVMRAVSSRSQLPILAAVKIEARKEGVVLSATDLELSIVIKLTAKVEEEGVVAVVGKTFGELLSTLNQGKLSLTKKGENLEIVAGSFRGKVLTMEVADFPAIGGLGEVMCKTTASRLGEAVNKVSFASARDSLRPALTGVLLELSQKLRLVATDGFRLAVASVNILGSSGGEKKLLVPSRAMSEAVRIIQEGEVEVSQITEAKQIIFETEQVRVVAQLIEGSFPDYNRILPKEFGTSAAVSREELLSAARSVAVFARDNSNMMKVVVAPGQIKLSSNSNGGGEGETKVEAKVEGEEVTAVFNVKYVSDYLALLASENVWVGLGGALAPGMIAESEAGKDENFYVVMPINV